MPDIRVNGKRQTIDSGACLSDLVDCDPRGIAIARNGEVVPRAQWAATAIAEDDEIEIVKAVQGG